MTTLIPSNTALLDMPQHLYEDLCLKLRREEAWTSVADCLINLGVSINKDALRVHPRPADKLLREMHDKNCNVGNLCTILRKCGCLHALAVLKYPEPVQIVLQPGRGQHTMKVTYRGQLKLDCLATSLPPPLYQWFRDNEQLSGCDTSSLEINEFSPELEGHYFCKIRSDGQGSQEVCSQEINVCVAPYLDIFEQPQGIAKQEGETVRLNFYVDGYPAPNFQWYKGNQLLDNYTSDVLNINYAKSEDSGWYRCVATNTAGDKESENVCVKVSRSDLPILPPSERFVAKEKLALLIGNVRYSNHEGLVRPVDDVALLAKKLTDIGFKVITLINLRLCEMRNAMRQFSHQLTPGVYGLFYFGGHGVQSDGGLMLPIDAPKDYDREHCLSEKEVRNMMLSRNPSFRVIILDMCLKAPDRPIDSRSHIFSQENATDNPDTDMILAYSTSGNLSAYERRSESNGTYVKFLSQFIDKEITIMGVFQKTHEAIYNDTKKMKDIQKQQIPMLLSNVFKKFCFTDQVSGDSDIERFFSTVFVPPMSEELDFNPSINIEPRPRVYYLRHRGCVLNAMEIQIRGIDLDVWNVKICSQKGILHMKDVPITESRKKDIFQAIVEDLQGPAVAGSLDLTIDLTDQNNCLIASTTLFVSKPLVANWFLWVEPDLPDEP